MDSFPEQRIKIASIAQSRLAHQAIQKLIGSTITSEKEFESRVQDILSQAIHDKNSEIYRLEKKSQQLSSELTSVNARASKLSGDVLRQKRIANAAQIKLHHQSKGVSIASTEAVSASLSRQSSWWRVHANLVKRGRQLRLEKGKKLRPVIDFTQTVEVTAMLQHPRLDTLLDFKVYVRKSIDQRWAHEFLQVIALFL